MNPTPQPLFTKKIIALVVVLAVLIIGLFVYNAQRFTITTITPNNKSYPSSLGTMDIYFSKKLDVAAMKQMLEGGETALIQPAFDSKTKTVVHDDHLSITFTQTPNVGKYTIRLQNITAKSGAVLNTTLPFNVVTVKYEDLSKADKARYDDIGDSGGDVERIDDPIITVIPYETSFYQISYTKPAKEGQPYTLTITMKFFEPGNNAKPATAEQKAAYLTAVRTYRQQALDYIKSKGFKLENYTLVYSELALRDEFPKGKAQ